MSQNRFAVKINYDSINGVNGLYGDFHLRTHGAKF